MNSKPGLCFAIETKMDGLPTHARPHENEVPFQHIVAMLSEVDLANRHRAQRFTTNPLIAGHRSIYAYGTVDLPDQLLAHSNLCCPQRGTAEYFVDRFGTPSIMHQAEKCFDLGFNVV
ncbi:hypothetical protein KZX46_01890 (plasmid) [Polymorphobacter sp. PAMC 29334]|uniref:hypothetical protein n=1 Tax=Polymorphobacter sp. PAMC 29334 TaxID=2862331 RepID=UPI001C787835|nr:hypothetical protein [Polymorphobacter sp. PAMC 29334]QYE33539.1 hypothetical protein KZX46_01890 [Polymorphobacter sp. PAMC 29334]